MRIVIALIVLGLIGTVFWFLVNGATEPAPSEPVVVTEPSVFAATSEGGEEQTVVNPPVPAVTDYRGLSVRAVEYTTVTTGLDAPWAFAWLPDGDVLVTERFGALQRVSDGVATAVSGVPEVLAAGQGGLLDVTVHPEFTENRFIYLSYSHGTEEGNRLRVARAELRDDALENVEVIFEVSQTKTGTQHFGSRFLWLPDGTLVFSVGDGGNPPLQYAGELIREQAQNLSTYFGKLIRINDDGSIPEDNPFVGRPDALPEIYSFGHRNVQGLTYVAERGELIVSEHGSKGGDELNRVAPGGNYGWPLTTFATEYDAFGTPISPDRSLPGTQSPLAVWTPTIAPSSVTALTGDRYALPGTNLFLAGMLLRSNTSIAAYATRPAGALFRIVLDGDGLVATQELIPLGEVRVRSVAQGPDGYVYVLTDTTGRQSRAGTAAGTIIRIDSF
jgi:glucose/arabinose dehydrogenase